jgi:hypothetical protein
MAGFIVQKLKILKFGSQETIIPWVTTVLLIWLTQIKWSTCFRKYHGVYLFIYLFIILFFFNRTEILSEKFLCHTVMLLHYLVSAVWLCVEIITRNAVD